MIAPKGTTDFYLNKTTGTIVTRSSEPKPKRNLFPAFEGKERKRKLAFSRLVDQGERVPKDLFFFQASHLLIK